MNAVKAGLPFDIVIMDLTIPGGMGGQGTNRLLQEKHPGAKVTVSSGYSNNPVIPEYGPHVSTGVIVKPYRFDELSETVRRVIGR